MQIKTIQNVIISKLEDWLSTIEDNNLAKSVKNNILLSGGSITSMLMNTDVNDFDIYIKDMDVLIKLAHYYTSGYDVMVMDGRLKQKYLDEDRNNDGENQYSTALRTLKEDQVKLFIDSGEGGKRVNENDDLEQVKYIPQFFSPNAISLSHDIQIVTRFNGDDQAIHKTFDFIHATNYFTFESGLVTNVKALESIITKQLYYQGSMYPLTSIIRMKKFIMRGWNINAGEILKIMFQISELNLKDADVLEDQLIGVDVAYFNTLIQALRSVDKDKMNSAYINKIIDKVFNAHVE